MMDLLNAKPLVEENIHLNTSHYSHLIQNASFHALDLEEAAVPMPDVTYNTTTFVALVETNEHLLWTSSKRGKVVCCGKRSQDEEEIF